MSILQKPVDKCLTSAYETLALILGLELRINALVVAIVHLWELICSLREAVIWIIALQMKIFLIAVLVYLLSENKNVDGE